MKTWVGLTIFATAVVGIVGGVAVNAIVNNKTNLENVTPIVEVTDVEEAAEVAVESPVETPAPQVDSEPEVAPTTPQTATTPKPSTPKTEQPKTTTTTQQTAPTSTVQKFKYDVYHEFEKAYVGWCPKKVPADAMNAKLNPAASLGYLMEQYTHYDDMESAALYAWAQYRDSVGWKIYIYIQELYKVAGWENLTAYALTVDNHTGKVGWEYGGHMRFPNGHPEDKVKRLNELAKQLTVEMDKLDQRFYNKCGSY